LSGRARNVHLILRILPAALLSVFANSTPAVPTAGAADWPTYQGSNSRSGVVSGTPAFRSFRRRFSRSVDGEVYAQPLIARGVIYVATENNTVYAFRTNGKPLFHRHLGQPVSGGDLPCGNIDPSGITGTPAISGNRLYVVAFLASGHQHVLYALDTRTGRVLMHHRVDAPDPIVQQERGALLVDHGRVYVPYGGLYGDCGPYHGYVISVTTGGGGMRTYANPSAEAGIWAPGGISEGPSGALLVATGNGAGGGPSQFEYANSVLRLSPTLGREGFWAPSDWLNLSGSDTDVGSVAPLPLPGGRVFQGGKDGNGYLLSPGLGGIGGELEQANLCDAVFGAMAVSPPYLIVPCTGALVAVRLEGNRFSVAWKVDGGANAPLIAGGAVIDTDKGGRLRALRLSDGHPLGASDLNQPASSFPSGAASGDLLVEPSGSSITAFGGL
jgi:outer membrane protein assembly factor BamB